MRLLQRLVNHRLRIIVIVVFLVVTWKLTQLVLPQSRRLETGGGGKGEGGRSGGKREGGRGRGGAGE